MYPVVAHSCVDYICSTEVFPDLLCGWPVATTKSMYLTYGKQAQGFM